mgnify:FL=1
MIKLIKKHEKYRFLLLCKYCGIYFCKLEFTFSIDLPCSPAGTALQFFYHRIPLQSCGTEELPGTHPYFICYRSAFQGTLYPRECTRTSGLPLLLHLLLSFSYQSLHNQVADISEYIQKLKRIPLAGENIPPYPMDKKVNL